MRETSLKQKNLLKVQINLKAKENQKLMMTLMR
jgi:hypothetical protein